MARSAPLRVLVLVENLSVPFDRRVWQESLALVKEGYDVQVVCPRGAKRDTEPYAELDGVQIHRYTLRPATGGVAGYVREYGLALYHSMRLALRVHRERPIDIVHACNPPDLLFLVALPFKAVGARFVFDHHDLVPELYQSRFGRHGKVVRWVLELLERLTFRTADHVISTNNSYRAAAIGRGGMAPARVTTVRSAPDLRRFFRVTPDADLRRGKEHLICYLGVMGPQDGVDYALRAVARLRHEYGRTDVHVAFIGSGDVYGALVQLAEDLNVGDCVEFTGRIPDEAVQRYLSTADICLAPDPKNPLNDVSTMNKIVEYMAMECPVVAFDLVEARVSAGEAAVYATPNDEAHFARLIVELLDDAERRQRMGGIGRARVEDDLSWEHSREHLIEAYEHVSKSAVMRRR